MLSLIVVLSSLALLDSLTFLPLAVPLQLAFLAGRRPYAVCAAFGAGILAVYLPIGLALALGIDAVLDWVEPRFEDWLHSPGTIDLLLQLALGAAMLAFGWRLARSREQGGGEDRSSGVSPGSAFALGAASTLAGLPGALPYLAAIDQILRFDVDGVVAFGALLYYNAVFLVPIAALPLLRALLGGRVDPLFVRLAPAGQELGAPADRNGPGHARRGRRRRRGRMAARPSRAAPAARASLGSLGLPTRLVGPCPSGIAQRR